MATYKDGDSATADTIMAAGKDNAVLGFVMWVLGAFAISVEVFLRRDFGERYFTRTKFVLGLITLMAFKFGSSLSNRMPSFSDYTIDPETGQYVLKATQTSFNLSAWLTYIFLLAYIILGSYHTFRIWWRNGTGRPLHSRDHGLTWLELVGALTLAIPNFFIGLVMRVYALTLPEHERPWLMNALPFLRDARGFAEKVVEPLVVLLLAILFSNLGATAVASWLYFSTLSLVLFTTIRHEQFRNRALDLQDQQIEARDMSSAMFGDTESLRIPYETKKALFEVTNIVESSSPEAMEAIRRNTPNLADAMEALNPKLKNMKAKKSQGDNVPPDTSPKPPDETPPPPVVNEQPPPSPEPPEEEKPATGSGISVEDVMKNLKIKK
jgi:hypothetical protein